MLFYKKERTAVSMENFLIVGLGGAAGAAGRYAVSLIPLKIGFPLLTMLTNLIGALLIGFIAGLSEDGIMREKWTLFWKTGVCGGFTTFSTFSLEAWKLIGDGKFLTGGAYILLSVILCILGAAAGYYFGKKLVI